LKNDLVTILHRSVVRSAADASHRNRRASFKSDVQESLKLLDTKPSSTFVWKDSHHKHKLRETISQENLIMMCQTELGLRQITQTSILAVELGLRCINVNNLRVQNLFFSLHDAIFFQGHGKSQAQDLQLGVLECKVYHNVLMNT
jgi:hypothetical protein